MKPLYTVSWTQANDRQSTADNLTLDEAMAKVRHIILNTIDLAWVQIEPH